MPERETLTFDDLRPYLLLQNGNYLYRIPYRGGFAVLKVYYGSRGTLSRLLKSTENVLLSGQTSYFPQTRRRIELECLEVWSRHGFRVFRTYDVDVIAPDCPPGGYTVFEYVDRPKLGAFMGDGAVPEDERFELWRRWLGEWGRRHEIAIAEREPRLVHENGDGKHVMLLEDGGFLWFDFEMIYRSRAHVDRHVSHEIVQYLWQITKTCSAIAERLIRETVEAYPSPERLQAAVDYFFRHPNHLHRVGRALDRTFSKRARKSTSKYRVAARIADALGSR